MPGPEEKKVGKLCSAVLHLATKMGEGGEACSEVRHVFHKNVFLTNVFDQVFGIRLTLQEMVRLTLWPGPSELPSPFMLGSRLTLSRCESTEHQKQFSDSSLFKVTVVHLWTNYF